MSLDIEVNILFLIIHKKKLRMRTVLIFLVHYLETREQQTYVLSGYTKRGTDGTTNTDMETRIFSITSASFQKLGGKIGTYLPLKL